MLSDYQFWGGYFFIYSWGMMGSVICIMGHSEKCSLVYISFFILNSGDML